MIVLGKPNLWSISQMNSTAWSDEIFVTSLTSIHLVNLSTATKYVCKTSWHCWEWSYHVKAPASERPRWRYGYQVVSRQVTVWQSIGILGIVWWVVLRLTMLWASRILIWRLCRPACVKPRGFHMCLHELPVGFLFLLLLWHISWGFLILRLSCKDLLSTRT